MIIECQSCHARFRLDESRIKGRGARVKCRKCGDSIVVLKEGASAPPPPPPGGEGFFDLGSAVRDSVGEKPASPAPPLVGNLIPFPAPARTAEPAGPREPSPGQAAPPPDEPPAAPFAPAAEKDEVDLAFDRFLHGEAKDSIASGVEAETGVPIPLEASAPMEADAPTEASAPTEADAPMEAGAPTETDAPTEAGAPTEDQAHAGPYPSSPSDLREPTLDFTPEESLDLPPVEAGEPQFGESPAAEPEAGPPVEEEFLARDTETLAFLREEAAVPQPEVPPRFDDISLAISSSPAEEGGAALRVPEPFPPTWTETTPAPDEISLEGNVTPPSTSAMEAPPQPEAMAVPPTPSEPAERRVSPAPEPPRARSSAGPVAAVVLAILLAAGGYFGFTSSGRKMLEGAVPGVSALWGGKPAAPTGARYDLRNVIGYYESGGSSPRILVIKGQVANLSGTEKSGIRVHASLLDNTDAVLLQQSVYAGNVLTGETIRKASRETVSKALGNRFGEGLANMHVAPGKSIPFMVVFFDAPANFESYKLEAKDGE